MDSNISRNGGRFVSFQLLKIVSVYNYVLSQRADYHISRFTAKHQVVTLFGQFLIPQCPTKRASVDRQ